MKAIIIDDEQNARENLLRKINAIDDSVEIIGEADNADSAYDLIIKLKPNAIFLDIEMPSKDGFELLKMFDKIDFQVVFVTAYNEFAIKAFKNFAFNYILKPIDNDFLELVIHNLNKLLSNKENYMDLRLLNQYIQSISTHSKIGIPTETGIDMIYLEDIISLEASDGYTIFKMTDGRSLVSSKRFQYFEDKLLASSFIKIHRSFFVNIKYIESYHKVGFVKLHNGDELPVSRSLKQQVTLVLRNGRLG